MSGLVEFLNARLDEDEALAQAAGEPDDHWQWRRNDDRVEIVGKDGSHKPDGGLSWHPDTALVIFAYWEEDGEHIERWAPHRVLREVEVKRQLLALHKSSSPDVTEFPVDYYCAVCESTDDAHMRGWVCQTVRLLALPYVQHPDYEAGWAP